MGPDGAVGGFTGLAEWRAAGVEPPKDRDFALGLGPVVVTPEAFDGHRSGFDWTAATALAAANTALYPGDILAGPELGTLDGKPGDSVRIDIEGIGFWKCG